MLKNNKEGSHLAEEQEAAKGPEEKQLEMLWVLSQKPRKEQFEKSQGFFNIQ